MDPSSYAPPGASVADVVPPNAAVRPRSATAALVVFGLYVIVSVQGIVFAWRLYVTGENNGSWLVIQVSWLAIFGLMFVLLMKPVTWVRWTLIPLAAWEIHELQFGFREIMWGANRFAYGPLDIILWAAPAVCSVAAIILVFGPARRWFRARTA